MLQQKPKNPLVLRAIVDSAGNTPVGCSGWGYTMPRGLEHGPQWYAYDGATVGRLAPCQYNSKSDCLVVSGPFVQMKDGEIVETFREGA